VLACSRGEASRLEGEGARRLGVVGGDRLLGIPLSELAAAYG
jgi:hypothetical protein